MDNTFQLLIEKEEIWARMLVEVLQDNGIPCTTRPVNGIGFTMKTGMQDSLQVFVPEEFIEKANELVDELFNAEIVFENEFCEDDIE